jgi:hypothetical protein
MLLFHPVAIHPFSPIDKQIAYLRNVGKRVELQSFVNAYAIVLRPRRTGDGAAAVLCVPTQAAKKNAALADRTANHP